LEQPRAARGVLIVIAAASVLVAAAVAFWLLASPDQPSSSPSASVAQPESGGLSAGTAEAAPPENRAPAPPTLAPKLVAAAAASSSSPAPDGSLPQAEAGAQEPRPGAGTNSSTADPSSKAMANKEDIRAAIKELLPQIRDCYEQGLKQNPSLDGKARVEFVLARAPDGGAYAREGEVNESTMNAPLVEACILSKLQTAHFRDLQGEGEVRVKYPFNFHSERERGGFGGGE
jgi:hypothetical protein